MSPQLAKPAIEGEGRTFHLAAGSFEMPPSWKTRVLESRSSPSTSALVDKETPFNDWTGRTGTISMRSP
jgi:hypothetical protein